MSILGAMGSLIEKLERLALSTVPTAVAVDITAGDFMARSVPT